MEQLYWKLQPLVAPGLRNSQNEYADQLRQLVPEVGRWLDLGCGHHFLPDWMPPADSRLCLSRCTTVGLDLDVAAIQAHPDLTFKIIATGERIPLRNGCIDLVTANMVLEHVRHPGTLFSEVARVLRPGGRFLVHTPNVYGYSTLAARCVPRRLRAALAGILQGRHPKDVYPTLYRANSRHALERLASEASLATLEISFIHSTPQLVRFLPAMVLELVWIRLMYFRPLAALRPCLLGVFQKPPKTREPVDGGKACPAA